MTQYPFLSCLYIPLTPLYRCQRAWGSGRRRLWGPDSPTPAARPPYRSVNNPVPRSTPILSKHLDRTGEDLQRGILPYR